MPTLFYSPAIKILVKTNNFGTIDVSDDVVAGSLSLAVNATHKLQFSLANQARKYDGVFTPNDRVVVRLKRITWLQVFAGYLDTVPFFSAYPREVPLEASCTLKRLKYTYWDPGTDKSATFLNTFTHLPDASEGGVIAGNLTGKAIAVLTDLDGLGGPGYPWPRDAIHMGHLPHDWIEKVYTLGKELAPLYAVPAELLGTDPVVNGTAATGYGTDTDPRASGKGYGALPVGSGGILTTVEGRTGLMVLSGEPRNAPADEWWCAMRWPFASDISGTPLPDFSQAEFEWARAIWKGAKILVVNPATGKSVVLRAADWGPSRPDLAYAMGMSDTAAHAIGATVGSTCVFKFAAIEAPPGSSGSTPTGTLAAASNTQGLGSADVMSKVNSVTWAPADHLTANTRAARDFIRATWPTIKDIGGWRPSDPYPDHPGGYALDNMVTLDGSAAQGDDKALGNSIAMWFVSNPNVFSTKYVIWYNRIATGTRQNGAWRPYQNNADNSPTQLHENHVHISFNVDASSPGVTGPGQPGGAWAGADPSNFPGGFAAGSDGGQLLNAKEWMWEIGVDPLSQMLVGERALMNDRPIFSDVQTFINTSMRDFCSAPNGDLIAWFPDYFGIYGLAGRLILKNIELQDFTMVWSDDSLITHQFTSGSVSGYGSPEAQVEVGERMAYTMGIASVEHPEIMEVLLNVSRDDPKTSGWTDANAILQRFGARPKFDGMEILTSPLAEFWYALHLFQRNWASMFSAEVPITFMPELFPGMLLVLDHYKVQFYVDAVTHSWRLGPGGGFTTTAHVAAPSSLEGGGFAALVRGGG